MKFMDKTIDGVNFFSISNDIGMEFVFSDLGAALYQIYIDEKPMLIGDEDLRSWMKTKSYFGKTIGRTAGRIRNGDLFYEGKHYKLETNEGTSTLHGGPSGYAFKKFGCYVENFDDGKYFDVVFHADSPDGDGGYPGNVSTKVTYRIYNGEFRFDISFDTESDRDTPISLTSHCYFNLGGYQNVANHSLYVRSSSTTKYDEHLIPLGFEEIPEDLDFRKLTPLEGRLDAPKLMNHTGGIDHAFMLDERKETKDVDVHLESPKYTLDMYTDFPSVVVYADNCPTFGRAMNTGYPEERHSGIAIEPEYVVGDYESMTVKKDKPQRNFIEYHFGRKIK